MLDEADVFLLPSVTGTDGDMEDPVALMEAMAVGSGGIDVTAASRTYRV
jgi:glycosyltransferase involved in cell wall biosynthesis